VPIHQEVVAEPVLLADGGRGDGFGDADAGAAVDVDRRRGLALAREAVATCCCWIKIMRPIDARASKAVRRGATRRSADGRLRQVRIRSMQANGAVPKPNAPALLPDHGCLYRVFPPSTKDGGAAPQKK